MKKGLIFYCLLLSVTLHILLVLFVRLEQVEKKEKEPIAIDIMGMIPSAPKPALQPVVPRKEQKPLASRPQTPSQNRFSSRPVLPFFPTPTPVPPRPAPPEPASGAIPQQANQMPVGGQNAPSTPLGKQAVRETTDKTTTPPRLKLPSHADLEKFSDEATQNEVKLPDYDMTYAFYIDSMRRRLATTTSYPNAFKFENLQAYPVVMIVIKKSGEMVKSELLESSGSDIIDKAAEKACFDAAPFTPLPKNWKKDRAAFVWIFNNFYSPKLVRFYGY